MVLDTTKKIQEEIKKTISAFDKIESIESSPFLFTRIKTNLHSQSEKKRYGFIQVLVSPRIALITVLFILNVVSAVFFLSKDSSAVSYDESFIDSITDDYYLSTEEDILNNLAEKE